MTKTELAEAAKLLYHELIDGDAPDDIADIYGWDEEAYQKIQKMMFATRAEEIRGKPSDHAYVEYIIEQKRNAKDLTDLINNLDQKRQYNMVLGAIRLRSEIADKILDRGFEFGLIQKQGQTGLGSGNTFNIIGGVDVNVMTAPQLTTAIASQLSELQSYMERFGNGKNIMELSTGPLHYGESAPASEVIEVKAEESEPDVKLAKKKRSIK
jgi:hypothetical protein